MNHLLGDPKKAKEELGWELETSFESLVEMMVEEDLKAAEKESILLKEKLISPTWENPIK